jgi:hypothetical protein
LFYVGRYLSAGNDPTKVAAYNELHEVPTARRVFRVLSVVWGIGLVIEASGRMVLAEALHTGTYIAVSPFITAITIGSLFAFTLIYTKRAELDAAALMTRTPFAEAAEPDVDAAGPLSAPLASHAPAGEGPLEGGGQPRPIE